MSLQLVADYDSDADEQLRKTTFGDPEISSSDDDQDEDEEEELETGAEANAATASQDSSRLPSQGTARPSSMQNQRRARQDKGITGLPTASYLFAEVAGPPQFLTSAVQKQTSLPKTAALAAMGPPVAEASKIAEGVRKEDTGFGLAGKPVGNQFSIAGTAMTDNAGRRQPSYEIAAAAVLTGEHSAVAGTSDRGTSASQRDVEGRDRDGPGGEEGGRRSVGASMPPVADASALLRICPSCQVPKTPAGTRGMVCPMCQDRPGGRGGGEEGAASRKKKEGAVKDKEKSKRMKGQSSHASWKSETEMQLRQTYD